ncbi:winged helix-turn-helix transcriptional regulator [Streptomyces sp. A7024]|uniref:Winged helix-turn-helix transcriptional regulator n=1 Tax=Streptomyces coryli TaxID=1128680 RepID=A0A6G4UEP1_9ACTN|nr:winged helix-turn-helix domain-containing protein [Streptomyces coryli]NGN70390.1 winged helix-turn-helix transcriptional regulator [Streptomyces coryli]
MLSPTSLARTAALLADPTRAAFCLALIDGRAWTAGELARHAGVAPSTASEHLARLLEGGLVTLERQGRHRYVRLAGPAAATLVEELATFAPEAGTGAGIGARAGGTDSGRPRSLRDAGRRRAEARARTCYDHLAGRLGVAIADAAQDRGLIDRRGGLALTEPGRDWLRRLGAVIPPDGRKSTRPLLRDCLDYSERRPHLAGAVGAALCRRSFELGWVERIGSGRAVRVTAAGAAALDDQLGLTEHTLAVPAAA